MSKLNLFKTVLTEMGYQPKLHDDFVAFQHEGGNYILPIDHEDESFVQVLFPNFWSFTTAEERARVHEAAAAVNAMVKTVKIFPMGDTKQGNTMAAVDLRLTDPNAFGEMLRRSLLALQLGCHQFGLAMMQVDGGLVGMLRGLIERLKGA